MTNRRQFDLVVFGAEPSGLAAAACAAKAGARCAIIKTGFELPTDRSVSTIPNFVWRQLDIHETEFSVVPVSAHVSIFQDGRSISTFDNSQKTQETLIEDGVQGATLWRDFQAELQRLHDRKTSTSKAIDPNGQFKDFSLDCSPTESMADMLNDYFGAGDLKTHLASITAMNFGIGGEEPGSCEALASTSDKSSWRIRNGEELVGALERICERLGIEQFASQIRRIQCQDSRNILIDFELGDGIRTKSIMACTPRIARAARLKVKGGASSIANGENAEAVISVKLSQKPAPPKGVQNTDDAIFFIAESPGELRAAQDAVLEGRTPDNPPLMFEFVDREIRVRAPYCPRVLQSEEGPREWTGQDRQALGKQVVRRLGEYLNGALQDIQRTDVKIFGATDLEPEHELNSDAPEILAPAPDMNEIGAAAKLALRLIDSE